MTRAEWIQQALLKFMPGETASEVRFEEVLAACVGAADSLDKSGVAPWDDAPPSETEFFRQALKKAREEEREACAQIIDTYSSNIVAQTIATRIRARG